MDETDHLANRFSPIEPDLPGEVLGHPFYVDKLGKDARWKVLLEKLGLRPSKA